MPPRVSPCKITSAGRSFQVVTAKVNQLLLNLSNVLKLQGVDAQLDPKSEVDEICKEAD